MTETIPQNAKKVFSWIRFDIYQWEQELYDGSTTTFERARFRDGSFVIPVLPDGQILMTIQEQPAREGAFHSLPGGAFDAPDEDPLECARRELFEETGYESDEWELWHVSRGTQNIITNLYFYIARWCRKSMRKHTNPDHGEKIALTPISYDAFLDLALDEKFHHWTLLPYMFHAKIDKREYLTLKQKLLWTKRSSCL
jgi:ADP-ribose pyrophosphatase